MTGPPGSSPTLPSSELDLVFMVDVSGSMASDAKIQTVNAAMEEAIPALRAANSNAADVTLNIRVLTVGTSVHWIGSGPVPVDDFWWPELKAELDGLTELGAAIEALMTDERIAGSNTAPSVVVISDGMPTDTRQPSFDAAVKAVKTHLILRATAWAAIAIGVDADIAALQRLTTASGNRVLTATSVDQIGPLVVNAASSVLITGSETIW